MTPDITLAVTSCQRHDLLERTLRSFSAFNRYPIRETVIVEDSELDAPKWLAELKGLGPVKWISNGRRKGQVYSCDRLMAEVQTPYAFWCEDDWEFLRGGFIEESLEILEYADLRRSEPMWTVSLRGNDCNGHPNVWHGELPFQIQEPYWREFWGGCNWNPGLRRLSDYERIGSYGRICGYGQGGIHAEQRLTKMHLDMGYRIAVLSKPAVKHIGEGRSKACEKLANPPKVLIAIPACHRYDYSNDPTKLVRNTAGRIEGQRATWLKDVKAFSSYVDYRIFFGRASIRGAGAGRAAGPDEIFLDVDDDYMHLPQKMRAIYAWALDHGYDYVFKCDDDTFVYVDRLMASDFETEDYTGFCFPGPRNYISGGPGYWLSKRAMQILVDGSPEHWAEDLCSGRELAKHGILPHRDPRYLPGFDKHYVDLDALPANHGYISFHACTPAMMQRLHEANPRPTFRLVDHALGEPKATVSQPANGSARRSYPGVLIGILSCHQRTHGPEGQRRTWLKDATRLGIEYRFFLGEVPQPKTHDPRRAPVRNSDQSLALPDQVLLNCPDGYDQLPQKTRAMIRWAYEKGYEYLFKCDDDTYLRAERLLSSGFRNHAYSGFVRTTSVLGAGKEVTHAQGGAGYWLSRKTMRLILECDVTMEGAEDINLARLLKKYCIAPVHDPRYRPDMLIVPTPGNQQITAHDCNAEDMYEIHAKFEFIPSLTPSATRPHGLSQELSVGGRERV